MVTRADPIPETLAATTDGLAPFQPGYPLVVRKERAPVKRHAGRVNVVVGRASEAEKPVVRRLLELNAYELSAVDGRDIGADGKFGYPYLDHYWGGADDRAALLVHVDGHLAGFALVRLGTPHR